MKTINQKEALANHPASTIAIDTVAAHTSIAETIARTLGDNTLPPQSGSSDAFLPSPFHNPGIDNLAARFADLGSNDPSKAGDHTDPLGRVAADAAGAMARLTGMDLTNHPDDPTQKTGINIGPGLPSAEALRAALAQDGIIVNANSGAITGSEPSKGDGQAAHSPSGHPQQPDGPPQEGHESKEESMFSAGGDNWSYSYKDAQGHEHQRDMYIEKGLFWVSDKDKTTGEQTDSVTQVTKKDTTQIEKHSDPKTGETTETTTHTNGRDTHVTVTDTKTGAVKQDGSKPAEVPLEPLHDDHKGGGAKTPDGDHQSALPSWLANQIHNEIYREIKSTRPDNHDGDLINVRNDGPDTASANDLAGTHGDKLKTLLGGDTSFENSQQGHGGGTPQPNYNGQAGAIDPGPDSDSPPQTNGPSPHDQHHVIATNPAGSHPSGGQQGNGDGQNSHQTLLPIKHLEAATMQDLVKAYEASHSGDHKTAQSVGDHHDSVIDNAWHAVDDVKDPAIHKVTGIFEKAIHDPQTLLNMAADAIKDPGTHTDAHASDGTTAGTSHAALIAETHAPALSFAGDSVESMFTQHDVAGAPDSHGTPVTLQDVLHGISSELNPNLLSALDGAHAGHALGSEANLFGVHDLIAAHQPEPAVPHFDGGMLVHSELASTSHSEFAHQLFG